MAGKKIERLLNAAGVLTREQAVREMHAGNAEAEAMREADTDEHPVPVVNPS